jgi:hypothetical protein
LIAFTSPLTKKGFENTGEIRPKVMAGLDPRLSGLIPQSFQHRHPGSALFAHYPGSCKTSTLSIEEDPG